MTQETLTLLSTSSIVASGLALVAGWLLIRGERTAAAVRRHRNAMLTATAFAGLFLVAYVTRWSLYGSKAFEGEGVWKLVYVGNLIPHILLAMAVGPLALYQIYLAFGPKNFRRHRKVGRITVPIWLYVAASGWLIYFLLYKVSY